MARRPALPERFLDHLRRRPDLVPPGSVVLVALSGGPDSTALLRLLHRWTERLELELRAAHFDHGLREGSQEEARRVAARCAALGVDCEVGRSGTTPEPTQEALRRARYGFLEEVADRLGADRIATGHQADDQAETVLFRILRGTGLRGLGGIPARRGRVVRPLLPFGRSELRAWLASEGADWIEDPSNTDPRWARGRLRTRVLPSLEEAWGEPVGPRLRELAGAARRAETALEELTRRAASRARRTEGGSPPSGWSRRTVVLDREALLDEPREIVGRVVRRLARSRDVSLTRGGTRAAIEFISEGRSGGRVDLGGGLELAREFDRILLGRSMEPAPDTRLQISGRRAGRGVVWIGGTRWRVEWDGGPTTGARFAVELAADALEFPLEARGRRPGDRLRRSGGDRKLKEAFREERVPASARDAVPLLVEPPHRVVWAAGLGIDPERAAAGGQDGFRVTWKEEES